MSSDNGIYILRTKGKKGGYEYRVAHCMAVENIDSDQDGNNIGEVYMAALFGASPVFATKEEALKLASFMEEEIADSEYPLLEYGISTIRKEVVFPDMTAEQANIALREYWTNWQSNRSVKRRKDLNKLN